MPSNLTRLRLANDESSQLDWLDVKRSLLAAQQGLVQTRMTHLQNQIALFKVLGGGAS